MKKFTYDQYKNVVNNAWDEFAGVLLSGGFTEEQVNEFYRIAESSISKVDDYLAQVISFEYEE